MTKLIIGSKMEDFSFHTVRGDYESFLKINKENNAVLIFLRYYGCTVCQYEMIKLNERLEEFKEKNTKVYVVLQSRDEIINKAIEERKYGFCIIGDESKKLYEQFEIPVVKTKEELMSDNLVELIRESRKMGLEHGEYEGEELQLPAVFIINSEGEITYAKYPKGIDLPGVDELVGLLKNLS